MKKPEAVYVVENVCSITNWKFLSLATPFGHVPLLEVDGVVIAESSAINRYLARQFGA
jgi:hypothetical protein